MHVWRCLSSRRRRNNYLADTSHTISGLAPGKIIARTRENARKKLQGKRRYEFASKQANFKENFNSEKKRKKRKEKTRSDCRTGENCRSNFARRVCLSRVLSRSISRIDLLLSLSLSLSCSTPWHFSPEADALLLTGLCRFNLGSSGSRRCSGWLADERARDYEREREMYIYTVDSISKTSFSKRTRRLVSGPINIAPRCYLVTLVAHGFLPAKGNRSRGCRLP